MDEPEIEPREKSRERRLGIFAGKEVEIDREWWKPMSDKEVDAFIGSDDFCLTPERT